MIEIRTIRPAEAETFLELLCTVFDLDYGRARSIFYVEPLFDLDRKWALFDGARMVSILTTVPLAFGWGRAIGVAGVATSAEAQGQGFAGKLLAKVLEESERQQEGAVLLFAQDTRVYERVGFEVIDTVVRGPIDSVPEDEVPASLDFEDVKLLYDEWSRADRNRLRRDDLRWNYWKWNLRVCTPIADGYLCFEGGVVREAVVNRPVSEWRLPMETEWLGLANIAKQIGMPLRSVMVDLNLMAYKVPGRPQFFMTDQF